MPEEPSSFTLREFAIIVVLRFDLSSSQQQLMIPRSCLVLVKAARCPTRRSANEFVSYQCVWGIPL